MENAKDIFPPRPNVGVLGIHHLSDTSDNHVSDGWRSVNNERNIISACSVSLYLKFYWRCGTIKVYGSTIFYWVFFVGPTPMNSNSQQTIILKTVLNHYLYKKIHGIMFKRSSKKLAYYRNWPLWFLIILQ